MKPISFVHGGGDDAYAFDLDIVHRLRHALGPEPPIAYTRIAGLEQIEWTPTVRDLSERFANLARATTVVAHSLGGAAVLKTLSTLDIPLIKNLFLLAPPYKAGDSHWGVDDFTFSDEFACSLHPSLSVTIYYSRDDDIIPFHDATLYQEKLPSAQVRLLDGYGHQFSGPLDFLADDIRSAT